MYYLRSKLQSLYSSNLLFHILPLITLSTLIQLGREAEVHIILPELALKRKNLAIEYGWTVD